MPLSDPFFLSHVLLLGAIAGFTIYLGLPIARLAPKPWARSFLNALSVGILMFLFVEIAYRLIEGIEQGMRMSAIGLSSRLDLWKDVCIFIGGFSVSILALVLFELYVLKASKPSPRRLSLLIATGIGFHNLSEGLAIGQSFATGALSLGYLLALGFALHNATEGFGIAGPLSGEKPTTKFLALIGLIGGGPTFVGTIIGVTFVSEWLESLFLSLAAGAILYVIGELIHLGRLKGQHLPATLGLLFGFFVAFGSELWIQSASMEDLKKIDLHSTIELKIEDYKFYPNHFSIPTGKTTKLVVHNKADMTHEIEILGTGSEIEQRMQAGEDTVIFIKPRHTGKLAMLCDMPGHLANGMYGIITVVNEI